MGLCDMLTVWFASQCGKAENTMCEKVYHSFEFSKAASLVTLLTSKICMICPYHTCHIHHSCIHAQCQEAATAIAQSANSCGMGYCESVKYVQHWYLASSLRPHHSPQENSAHQGVGSDEWQVMTQSLQVNARLVKCSTNSSSSSK